MITNDLLKTKYETQKQLDEESQHDIRKYVENTHKIVLEAEKKYGIQFMHRNIQGGIVEQYAKIA